MTNTQEKLRRAMMTGPNRWAEATINGKLVSYYEIHDETILLDLIDSAKREGAIEFAKKADQALDGLNIDIETTEKHIRKVFGHDERLAKRRLYEVTTEAEDRADIIDECRYAIAQLEQSEESE